MENQREHMQFKSWGTGRMEQKIFGRSKTHGERFGGKTGISGYSEVSTSVELKINATKQTYENYFIEIFQNINYITFK